MKKTRKIRIFIILVCGTVLVVLTYLGGLPWWFNILWLSPGPLIILMVKIYEKMTGKKLIKT